MRLAVLPFSAASGARVELARQIPTYCADLARSVAPDLETQMVSLVTQIEQDGSMRAGLATMDEYPVQELFEQFQAEAVLEGKLSGDEASGYQLEARFHVPGAAEPKQKSVAFDAATFPAALREIAQFVGDAAGGSGEVPAEVGSDVPGVLLSFLDAYDALIYLQQANGAVLNEFSPDPAIDALIECFEKDPGFLAAYTVGCQLCRACANYRVGTYEKVEASLKRLAELAPEEFVAHMALGELYQMANRGMAAAEAVEKAVRVREERKAELDKEGIEDPLYDDDLAALYIRLGLVQLSLNMPVNAEANFRKAAKHETQDRQALDYLSMVLQQTGRAHEVPGLWKDLLDQEPNSGPWNVKYALALYSAGNEAEGEKAFERGLEMVEDNAIVKRYYAKVISDKHAFLLQQGGEKPDVTDLDRALDFYEDCLDVEPADIDLNLEYARTLGMADRNFEVPQVLRNVLGIVQDPDTRAEVLAWLIELEQPKRVEAIAKAGEAMNEGQFDAAVKELKPLKNWLGDYWKMWWLLSAALNRVEAHDEAEEAARKLLELYPSCEPGYIELAGALAAQDKHEEAYHVMRHGMDRRPQSGDMLVNLALAAKRSGRDDEARALAMQLREAAGPNAEQLKPVFDELER